MNICISERSLGASACFSKRGATRPALISYAVGLLVALSPAVLQGQASGPLRESLTVGLAGGVFNYESSGDQGFPIFVVRADQPVSKWVRLEAGTSYARPEVQTDSGNIFDPSLPAEHANLFAVTVGFQLRLTVGRLEPYGGVSAGFFGRYDGDSAGTRFGRSTLQFPFGIRLWVTDHIGVRGEYRFDEDRHQLFTHSDSEMTAGVFWTF
jgi:hypothetical protein